MIVRELLLLAQSHHPQHRRHGPTAWRQDRTHLGVETQRQWSDLAILRTTPALFALFSLITLFAHQLGQQARFTRQAVWSDKSLPTFVDALAAVRREP